MVYKAVLTVLMLSLTSVAQALAFDVANDFSIASNPNGVWTYGYSSPLGGTLNLYDQPSTDASGNQFWQSTVVQLFGTPTDFKTPAGTTAFHPGPNGEYSVYRFTTPSPGTYDLGVSFTGFSSTRGFATTDVYVLLGSSILFSNNIVGNATASYASSLLLAANDIVDFAVGNTASSAFLFDTTYIAATLTTAVGGGSQAPEPVSLALLGIGLAGLTASRRRKTA